MSIPIIKISHLIDSKIESGQDLSGQGDYSKIKGAIKVTVTHLQTYTP